MLLRLASFRSIFIALLVCALSLTPLSMRSMQGNATTLQTLTMADTECHKSQASKSQADETHKTKTNCCALGCAMLIVSSDFPQLKFTIAYITPIFLPVRPLLGQALSSENKPPRHIV